VKFGHVIFEICEQTGKEIDTLITMHIAYNLNSGPVIAHRAVFRGNLMVIVPRPSVGIDVKELGVRNVEMFEILPKD